jgi:CheY-like chemotaxis protein
MAATVLHVEDDPLTSELVRHAFESFGFRGEFLSAGGVADAVELITLRKREGRALDLILSDMQLPDGTGLDLLRSVKANPAWATMPVIFLSADRDPKTIAEAYTLGANCFLSKLPRSRSVFKELKSLYDCWFETAFLPPEAPVDPVRDLLAKAVSLRSRSADLCNRLARAFVREPEVLGFWLDRALSECNLANICAFLLSQSTRVPIDSLAAQRIAAMQSETERRLRDVDGQLRSRRAPTPDEAYAWDLDIIDAFDEGAFADGFASLFPIAPVAMRALKTRLVVQLRATGAQILAHAGEPALRERAQALLTDAERLRCAVDAEPDCLEAQNGDPRPVPERGTGDELRRLRS